MRQQQLRASRAKSVLTAAQERYTGSHVASIRFDPPLIDPSLRTPMRETLLGCQRNQLGYPFVEDCMIPEERQQNTADRQARSQ